MSGEKETLLEKILKPVRINPATLGISLANFGLWYMLGVSDRTMDQLPLQLLSGGVGGLWVGMYLFGVHNYFRDRRILKERGFDKRHGKLRMRHYCDRQAFNVASIETGYRNEVTDLIRQTPTEEKLHWYLPHN